MIKIEKMEALGSGGNGVACGFAKYHQQIQPGLQ